MPTKSTAVAAASLLAAAAIAYAAWPSKPLPVEPCPPGTPILTHEAVRLCSDAGGCYLRESLVQWTAAPDAGGHECGHFQELELSPKIPVVANAPILHPVTRQPQAVKESRVKGLSILHPHSLGCTCWDLHSPCTRTKDGKSGPCPVATTMEPGQCVGGGCLPTVCTESQIRACPGCQMTAACREAAP